jgi:hypothetical protein
MFSEQPHPTTTSAPPITSAASGEANPPLTSRSHGLPRNSPLAAADVASSAPHSWPARSSSPRAPRAPRPAMNTGRLALSSVLPSDWTASGDGPGPMTELIGVSGGGCSHCAAWTSSGRERITVRRPIAACQARATSPAADAGERSPTCSAPTAAARPATSTWKLDLTSGASATSTISGVRLLAASVMPVIALVRPGPWWTDSMPTWRVVRAQASAMTAAPPSCRAAMNRAPPAISAFVTWKLPLPTTPNTVWGNPPSCSSLPAPSSIS